MKILKISLIEKFSLSLPVNCTILKVPLSLKRSFFLLDAGYVICSDLVIWAENSLETEKHSVVLEKFPEQFDVEYNKPV